MKRRNLTIPALLALMLAGSVPPTVAQTGNEDDADGPGRGVARLSLMNGEVSVRRGDSGDWVAGAINAPLMTEDRVFAGPRSRAEVQFDYYHRIRLAADTEVRLADIENGRYLLQLARGTATFSALRAATHRSRFRRRRRRSVRWPMAATASRLGPTARPRSRSVAARSRSIRRVAPRD
ncbi:MAG TPA: hypothetical protein PKJ41_02325 [Bryobacteraceae bacterium]|nr:hypothetical protein [Bryobacteraceae bacterium]